MATVQLSQTQAEAAIVKVIAVLEEEATKAKLLAIMEEVGKLPAEQQQIAQMMQLMPAVTEATAPVMAEYGFEAAAGMMFMMQLQQHAMTSPIVKDGVAKLQDTMAGKAEPAAPSSKATSMTRAVLIGSGSDGMNEQEAADCIVKLTGKEQPRILYLGAATYDMAGPRERQTVRFAEAGCMVMSLDLATPKASEGTEAFAAKLRGAVEAADAIVVSGGNTLYAADRFVKVGLLPLLREAMERGCVLTGGSAGAICWFDSGHSDSMDPDSYRGAMLGTSDSGGDESSGLAEGAEAKPWEYIKIPCLGLIPGLCCPHHDQVQSNGVLRAIDFDAMLLRHPGEVGIAIDHWAALVIEGEDYRVLSISGKPGSVTAEGGFEAGAGKPGIWLKEVVDGAVRATVVPAEGKVCDLLKPATAIVDDPRVAVCRTENAPPAAVEAGELEPEAADRKLDVAGIAKGERPNLAPK